MQKLSVVVAFTNQLPMNRLFLERLREATDGPYEVIAIDNASTDGSGEYFRKAGARVLVNEQIFGYGHCQNQGFLASTGDLIAFLNNDLIMSLHWDTRLREIMEKEKLDVVTPCTAENVENRTATQRLMRRWKRVKNPTFFLLGPSRLALRLTHWLMYSGDYEGFVESRYRNFHAELKEGFVGCAVVMTRRAIELIGSWDPRVQAADFDIFIRSKDRSKKVGDLRPCHIALGVYVHHYIRLTSKRARKPFVDQDRFITIEEKWGEQIATEYLAHIDD